MVELNLNSVPLEDSLLQEHVSFLRVKDALLELSEVLRSMSLLSHEIPLHPDVVGLLSDLGCAHLDSADGEGTWYSQEVITALVFQRYPDLSFSEQAFLLSAAVIFLRTSNRARHILLKNLYFNKLQNAGDTIIDVTDALVYAGALKDRPDPLIMAQTLMALPGGVA